MAEVNENLINKKSKCIILPDNPTKVKWNLIVGLLLIYTGIFVPLRVAFFDKASISMIMMECGVDTFFLFDVFLTLLTAYEN